MVRKKLKKRNPHRIIRAVTASMSLVFCREVMLQMRSDGYEMVALSSPGPELDSMRDNDEFHCIEVPMERHIAVFKDLRSLVRIILAFVKEKPQMVHSMTPKAGLLCMLAAKITGVPIRIHTFTGLIWPTASGLSRRILMFTDWLTCACASHVIPEGEGVMNDLKNGGITRKPMKVLGYGNVKGVDMEKFNPERFQRKDCDCFTFLFVGRLVGDKGINELVDAFVRLNREYPNTCLKLVGRFEEKLDPLKPEIIQMIEGNGAIIAEGAKYDDSLLEEYVNSDCFVMPSYREGFPNTVLEAGAMGLPCIVTDINGSREIIVDEIDTNVCVENVRICKNGLIVPARNINALYDAMQCVMNNAELREMMTNNARQMIVNRFEKKFVQSCQMNFYKGL